MAIYAYIRSSDDKQENSANAQRDRIVKESAAMGHAVPESGWFVDEFVSSRISWDKRPAGAKLCKIIRPGDTLYVAKFDRLFRSMAEWCRWRDFFASKKINMYFLSLGSIPMDWRNPVSKFVVAIMAAVAELERDMISERTSEGLQSRRVRGLRVSRNPGVGFRYSTIGYDERGYPICEKVVDPNEAELADVITVYHDEHGETLSDILKWLIGSRKTRNSYIRRRKKDGSLERDVNGHVIDEVKQEDWSLGSLRQAIVNSRRAKEAGGWEALAKNPQPHIDSYRRGLVPRKCRTES